MSTGFPSVLILGHSFVKLLKRYLRSCFDPRADSYLNSNLGIPCPFKSTALADVLLAKLWSCDLLVAERIAPNVLILKTKTNDLVNSRPEVVG